MGKKIHKQKGGITTDEHDFESAFIDFIRESKFTYVTSGAGGVIFKARFYDTSSKSPYYSFRTKNYGEPANVLIIKVMVLHEDAEYDGYNDDKELSWTMEDGDDSKNYDYVNPDRFKEEVVIQSLATINTMNYLEPLSPVIVFSDIYDNNDAINFFNLVLRNPDGQPGSKVTKTLNRIVLSFKNAIEKTISKNVQRSGGNCGSSPCVSKPKLGIIAMELIDTTKFTTMSDFSSELVSNNPDLESAFKNARAIKNKILALQDDKNKKNFEKKLEKIKLESEEIMKKDNAFFNFQVYKNMARLAIIGIANKIGFTQGDFHFANIFVDPDYEDYYMKKKTSDFPAIDNNDDSNNINSVFQRLKINEPKDPYDSSDVESTPSPKSKNTHIRFLTPDSASSNMKGGSDIDEKGRVMIIDYGYARKIDEDKLSIIDENINYIGSNLKTITLSDYKERINKCLNVVYNTPRSDGDYLNEFDSSYYGWFIGEYFCSLCVPNYIFKRDGLTDEDYKQLLSLQRMRVNAIHYLLNRPSTKNLPFKLPLDKETLVKMSFNALEHYKQEDEDEDEDDIQQYLGGSGDAEYDSKTLARISNKCFRTIGYGLKSIESLKNKVEKMKTQPKTFQQIQTPYKMIDTSAYNLNGPIGVGVGGKVKKTKTKSKTIKKSKSRKTKTRKHKKNRK